MLLKAFRQQSFAPDCPPWSRSRYDFKPLEVRLQATRGPTWHQWRNGSWPIKVRVLPGGGTSCCQLRNGLGPIYRDINMNILDLNIWCSALFNQISRQYVICNLDNNIWKVKHLHLHFIQSYSFVPYRILHVFSKSSPSKVFFKANWTFDPQSNNWPIWPIIYLISTPNYNKPGGASVKLQLLLWTYILTWRLLLRLWLCYLPLKKTWYTENQSEIPANGYSWLWLLTPTPGSDSWLRLLIPTPDSSDSSYS